MTRYLLLINTLLLSMAAILLFAFNYTAATAVFHVVVVLCSELLLVLLLLAVRSIRNIKTANTLTQAISFIYFFVLTQLYLMILSSNYFWKKTITYPVIKNYFFKLPDFISALPVEKSLFYAFFVFELLLVVAAYYAFRPRESRLLNRMQLIRRSRTQYAMIGATIILLAASLFFAKDRLIATKRIFHFQEEPVMQFFFGNIWGEGNEMAFTKERYLLSEKDKACLDTISIVKQTNKQAIVVILVDALRPDHLPAYGYHRKTTPFLDSLTALGQLMKVQHAFSPSTNTVGGIAGLFYSRDWTEFGYGGLNLMKYLKNSGFTTYSYLTGYHRDWFGLSALYRSSSDVYYESPKDPSITPDDDLVTAAAFEQQNFADRSFIYVHLLSTHTIGKKAGAYKKFLPDKAGLNTDYKTALINNYDNGILQADATIRRIFQKLKTENLLDSAIVYIISDHGELFGENERWSHGGSVHPNLVEVPLIIFDRNKDWYKNLETATLKDIAPTIVQRIGQTIPACWEGQSLHNGTYTLDMEINSVTDAEQPYGRIHSVNNELHLQIFDRKKRHQALFRKRENKWLADDNK